MTTRATTTIIFAVLLILVVMAVSAGITFLGFANNAKFADETVWEARFDSAQSMKILDFTGDGRNELFIQNEDTIALFDAQGAQLWEQEFSGPIQTTLGDVNRDGVEDVVVFHPTGLVALDGQGRTLWETRPTRVSTPYRTAVVRFPSGPQVLIGDAQGQVVAYDAAGGELWRGATTITNYIRGLDDVRVSGVFHAAVANYNGLVKVFDEQGQELWSYQLSGDLRRLRAYDLDGDGNGELLIGGDSGRLVMLDAATGAERFSRPLGQRIVEIREAELNGDPSSREFVVGGRDGGVWAFSATGTQLWSATISNRVNEIIALDVDGDGTQEVAVGDEGGQVIIFTGRGHRQTLGSWPSDIARLDTGRLTAGGQLAVADLTSVKVLNVRQQRAPIWYSPLLAGLGASFVIAFAAWFVATMPAKPVLRVKAEDNTVEGLLARNRMLHESLADVERLRGNGEMPSQAYLARLRELRGELADTQAALIKAGQNIRLETFKCPNCGGALPLGLDKCEYCGQIVIG